MTSIKEFAERMHEIQTARRSSRPSTHLTVMILPRVDRSLEHLSQMKVLAILDFALLVISDKIFIAPLTRQSLKEVKKPAGLANRRASTLQSACPAEHS